MSAAEWGSFIDNLKSHNYNGAILGKQGVGKSTLLKSLPSKLPLHLETYYLKLTAEKRLTLANFINLATCPNQCIILLDGAEVLNSAQWALIKFVGKQKSGLIITAHQSKFFPVLIHIEPTVDLLFELCRRLYENERLTNEVVRDVCYQNEGNIRKCLLQLYNIFSDFQSV